MPPVSPVVVTAVEVGLECVVYAPTPTAQLRTYPETVTLAPPALVPVEAVQLRSIADTLEEAITNIGAAI